MKLSEYIKKHKIKQKTLAKKIGVSEQTISHWLTGYCKPSYENAVKIYLKTNKEVEVDEFFDIRDKRKPNPVEKS